MRDKYNLYYTWLWRIFMSQITLYLDKETESKMRAAAEASGMSLSKWVANLIRQRTATEWPASVIELAGAWKDLPTAEEIREGTPRDLPREVI
jgi:hypothetical protein